MPTRRAYWPYLIALIALAARLVPGPRSIDDAFITFRYARNLLAGVGLVYNPGERVFGTTTPLYTLLMAALGGLTRSGNYPELALLVNAFADVLTCLILARLGERLSGQRLVGLCASLLWAIAPMSVTFAIGGMETSVFILLLVGTAELYLSGRTRWAALTAGLLLLTRPDGALFVGPLILDLLWRRGREKKFPLVEASLCLTPLIPWVIFATLYFGSPLTHSIAAKSLAYRVQPGGALLRLLQNYATPFFEQMAFPNFYALVGFLIAYLGLSVIGALYMLRHDARAWPIVLYPLLYFITFVIANPLIFRWYLAPPLPFYFLLILTGLHKVSSDLVSRIPNSRHASRFTLHPSSFFLLPFLFFLLLSLHAWVLHPDHGPDRPAPEMAWVKLELLYAQVGRDLAARVTPPTVVAAGDVGALGYYSNARILDTVGLISPEASAYFPLDPALYAMDVYAVPPKLITDRQPDYVVELEIYGRKGLFVDPQFLAEYELVEKITTDLYGSDGMLVWERRAAP